MKRIVALLVFALACSSVMTVPVRDEYPEQKEVWCEVKKACGTCFDDDLCVWCKAAHKCVMFLDQPGCEDVAYIKEQCQ